MFNEEVLVASKTQPVLLDFWAPWCGPCRMLGPILERLSSQYQGRVRMVKINSDHAPELSKRYQIRSIPTVMLFKGGQSVDQFMGLRSEPEIRRFIDAHLPRVEDDDLANARLQAADGRLEDAIASYEKVIAWNPDHEAARLEYVFVLLRCSRWSEAAENFSALRSKQLIDPKIAAAEVLIDAANSMRTEAGHDSVLNSQQRELRDAQGLMLAGKWGEAMEKFIECLEKDRKHSSELIRKSMIAIFQFCPDPQLVGQYRRRLGALLN